MQVVPNQKIIKINKETYHKNSFYAVIDLLAMETAAKNLGAGAFKLWVYLARNPNQDIFALSCKEVNDTFGIKKGQYHAAVKKLIEEKYLIAEEKDNQYTFYEIPQK